MSVNEKKKPPMESFWFTAVMSIVSLVVLAECVVRLASGDTGNLIKIPIWVLIAYHFLSVSYRSWQEPSGKI